MEIYGKKPEWRERASGMSADGRIALMAAFDFRRILFFALMRGNSKTRLPLKLPDRLKACKGRI